MINWEALEQHKEHWEKCRACPLGAAAYKHVLLDIYDEFNPNWIGVLFIGEAPGESEDAIGKPFIGRSGKLLRETIREINGGDEPLPYAFANCLACRPFDVKPTGGHSNRIPNEFELKQCSPRVKELLHILDPVVVLTLGRTSQYNFPDRGNFTVLNAPHPSFILRSGYRKSPYYKAFRSAISNAFEIAKEHQP